MIELANSVLTFACPGEGQLVSQVFFMKLNLKCFENRLSCDGIKLYVQSIMHY